MTSCLVDTNVAIVANGRADPSGGKTPSLACRLATIKFLTGLVDDGVVLVDDTGLIVAEYRKHLNPKGQPGVGDRFYQVILQSSPQRVERLPLPLGANGEFEDLPQSLIDAKFDPSDRKFAAMAKRYNRTIYNATDSDWIKAAEALDVAKIKVDHLCGCDTKAWFTPNAA